MGQLSEGKISKGTYIGNATWQISIVDSARIRTQFLSNGHNSFYIFAPPGNLRQCPVVDSTTRRRRPTEATSSDREFEEEEEGNGRLRLADILIKMPKLKNSFQCWLLLFGRGSIDRIYNWSRQMGDAPKWVYERYKKTLF